MKNAWLVQMVTDWTGIEGTIRRFSFRYRAVDYPVLMKTNDQPEKEGTTIICRGKVTDGDGPEGHFIECDLWVENMEGVKTTEGKAVVILPCRKEPC